MNITRIQPGIFTRNLRNTNSGAKKNNDTPSVTSPVIGGLTQDTVSFKGNVTNAINSVRKWQDYGDIFKEGANLAGEILKKAKADSKKLINANLQRTDFSKSALDCCNFSGANLIKTNFENANLEGCLFKNVKTEHTNFNSTYLRAAVFKGDFGVWTDMERANLCSANFKEANLKNINFSNSIYDNYTKFPKDFIPEEEGLRKFEEGCDIGKDFARMKLRTLQFTNMDLNRANFKRTDLKACLFNNCDISTANLKRAYLKKATINNCDLKYSELKQANFDKASLYNVDMRDSNVRGAILTWSDAVNVNLKGATYDQYTVFPAGFDPKKAGMIYVESQLSYYGIK